MPENLLKIGVEEVKKTAILKISGAFIDFQAKDIVNIVSDLLAKDFLKFILNLNSCTDLNNYGVSILINMIGLIKQKNGHLILTHLSDNQEKKLKTMGLTNYADFFCDDESALKSI